MVDNIPPDHFLELFERIAEHVRLGRVRNPEDIKKRISRILKLQRQAYQTAKRGSTIKKYRGDYVHLRTLYRHNVHKRIWNEAVENPGGIVDLTLDYGYDNAKRIRLEESRRRAGKLRRLRRR